MAFCKNCGKELPENATFCSSCGTQVGQGIPQAAPVYAEPTEFTQEFSAEERTDCRVLASLVYVFSFLGMILALLIRPNSKFIKFHVNQALVLNISYLFLTLVAIVPILGWIVAGVGYIVLFVFLWIGFARALNGRACFLPLIGKYKVFDYKK